MGISSYLVEKKFFNIDFTQNLILEIFGLLLGVLITLYLINRLTSWQQIKTQAPIIIVSLEKYINDMYKWFHEVLILFNDGKIVTIEKTNSNSDEDGNLDIHPYKDFIDKGQDIKNKILANPKSIVNLYVLKRQKGINTGDALRERLNFIQVLIPNFPIISEIINYLNELCIDKKEEFENNLIKWKRKDSFSDHDLASCVLSELKRFLFVLEIINILYKSAVEVYRSKYFSCLHPKWNPSKFSDIQETLLFIKK